ncbi:MAG: nucleotidyl transferase AbiEii/AbiGii toxin family protein [Verrucomicrobia bacterium]|nr:nucleotidyl transferase AbiEii/AbiGii toxin family protein [Verrucomicrobiota bacterium]MBU4292002.1 nucleotidyl transferase AbiEii/AbiGii toxin family protein [Verrucomicrobiota bacterium]MBU4427890.1 nucleotidyl transferase AbiEii/AbiGii toxin family protein [Verrucomicrobiota bacterium]MCG2678836.1 nucleotidyl transferase AbiEii/AbiGii toxin family protein [Kiritimatiellia bacterium]
MTRAQPVNTAASVKQRLLNLAREKGDDFQAVLQRYGLERILYRLGQSPYVSDYVLKGAQLFLIWHGDYYRPTADADLLGRGSADPEDQKKLWTAISQVPCKEDGLTIDTQSIRVAVSQIGAEYSGVRITMTAFLERTRIPLQVDIGFGDAVVPRPRRQDFPVLLQMPAPRLSAYCPETVVAEKFEAMVKLGLDNSRMKDFYDLWLLARDYKFDGDVLAHAIKATFARRKTRLPETTPVALTEEFYNAAIKRQQWKAFLNKGQFTEREEEFGAVCHRIRMFIMPVVESIMAEHGHSKH